MSRTGINAHNRGALARFLQNAPCNGCPHAQRCGDHKLACLDYADWLEDGKARWKSRVPTADLMHYAEGTGRYADAPSWVIQQVRSVFEAESSAQGYTGPQPRRSALEAPTIFAARLATWLRTHGAKLTVASLADALARRNVECPVGGIVAAVEVGA